MRSGKPWGSGAPLTTQVRTRGQGAEDASARRAKRVGTAWTTVTSPAASRRSIAATSGRRVRTTAAPARSEALSTALIPKLCARGRAPSWTSSAPSPIISVATAPALRSSPAWEWRARRGVPVVPEVERITAGAPGGSGRGSTRGCSTSAARSTVPGSAEAVSDTTSRRAPVRLCSRATAAAPACSGSQASTRAATACSTRATSAGGELVESGATTQPARRAP